MVGRGFASRPGHTKYHQECVRVEVQLTVQPVCLKGRVMCGNVYGDMHLKYFPGINRKSRVLLHTVPDNYLVLHGLCCRKIFIMD